MRSWSNTDSSPKTRSDSGSRQLARTIAADARRGGSHGRGHDRPDAGSDCSRELARTGSRARCWRSIRIWPASHRPVLPHHSRPASRSETVLRPPDARFRRTAREPGARRLLARVDGKSPAEYVTDSAGSPGAAAWLAPSSALGWQPGAETLPKNERRKSILVHPLRAVKGFQQQMVQQECGIE